MSIKETLTKKVGPLPVWAWGSIGTVAVFLLAGHKSGVLAGANPFTPGDGSGTGGTGGTGGDVGGGGTGGTGGGGGGSGGDGSGGGGDVAPAAPSPTPIGSDVGKYVLTNDTTGGQSLAIVGPNGDTQALTYEQLTNPNKNPLINLLSKVNPLTGTSPLQDQSNKEVSQVSAAQAGTGVPVGYRPDGTPLLVYFKSPNTFAPILTGPVKAVERVTAISPASVAEQQTIPPVENWNQGDYTNGHWQLSAAQQAQMQAAIAAANAANAAKK